MTNATREVLREVADLLDRASREETAREDLLAQQAAASLAADIHDRIAFSKAMLDNMVLRGQVGEGDRKSVDDALKELAKYLGQLRSVRTSNELTPALLADVTGRMRSLSEVLSRIAA